jgi:predicted metal-dependent peptidase
MTKAQTTWDTMTPRQRLAAVNIDIMDHIDFSILSGLVTMGEIHVVPDLPTAGTNGVDVFYGEAFVMTLNRKQLRFVQLHETMHKSLRHCSEYTDICEKYPELSNVAMDYVVNAFIEQTDPEHKFMEFPDAPEPLLDPKYYNKAFVDILQDLLRNPPPPPPDDGKPEDGNGGGRLKPLDEHIPTPKGLDKDELSKRVRDALTHGEMVQKRIAKNAGKASAGNPLSGLGRKRDTDWRNALRDWVQEICAGDEYSRYNPPNRRMLPLGIILPTHFDVAMDELHIYCDTSGSMHGVYPVVFGEIANICSQANPETVRIVWWDSAVCGEQVFKRGQYDLIANQLAPKGGGGTSPQCVYRLCSIQAIQTVWCHLVD